MAKFTTTEKLGVAVCEALNLDPSTVSDITLHLGCGDVLRATVEHLVTVESERRLIDVVRGLKHYELHPKDEQPEEGEG